MVSTVTRYIHQRTLFILSFFVGIIIKYSTVTEKITLLVFSFSIFFMCLLKRFYVIIFLGKKCTYGKKCKYFHPECPRPASESIVGKKTDNNRKTSKFSLALAADLIQRTEQYYHVPSTTPNSSNHQSTSMVSLKSVS